MAVPRDFWPFLSHELNPPGPLTNRLKWFCWKICFCRDICKISDSGLTNTARSHKIKTWLTLHVVGLDSDSQCAESDSAMTNTASSQTPRLLHCAESNKIVLLSKFKHLHLKGIQGPYVDLSYYFRRIFENPKLTNTAQSQTPCWLTLRGVRIRAG